MDGATLLLGAYEEARNKARISHKSILRPGIRLALGCFCLASRGRRERGTATGVVHVVGCLCLRGVFLNAAMRTNVRGMMIRNTPLKGVRSIAPLTRSRV